MKIIVAYILTCVGGFYLATQGFNIAQEGNAAGPMPMLFGLAFLFVAAYLVHLNARIPVPQADLEINEIFETVCASVEKGKDGMHVVVLRNRNGVLLTCTLKEVPPPMFKVIKPVGGGTGDENIFQPISPLFQPISRLPNT